MEFDGIFVLTRVPAGIVYQARVSLGHVLLLSL